MGSLITALTCSIYIGLGGVSLGIKESQSRPLSSVIIRLGLSMVESTGRAENYVPFRAFQSIVSSFSYSRIVLAAFAGDDM